MCLQEAALLSFSGGISARCRRLITVFAKRYYLHSASPPASTSLWCPGNDERVKTCKCGNDISFSLSFSSPPSSWRPLYFISGHFWLASGGGEIKKKDANRMRGVQTPSAPLMICTFKHKGVFVQQRLLACRVSVQVYFWKLLHHLHHCGVNTSWRKTTLWSKDCGGNLSVSLSLSSFFFHSHVLQCTLCRRSKGRQEFFFLVVFLSFLVFFFVYT